MRFLYGTKLSKYAKNNNNNQDESSTKAVPCRYILKKKRIKFYEIPQINKKNYTGQVKIQKIVTYYTNQIDHSQVYIVS